MTARSQRPDSLAAGAAVLMVLCCTVGPAVVGAAAGSAVGGWLGIACAVLVTAVLAWVQHRRRRTGCS